MPGLALLQHFSNPTTWLCCSTMSMKSKLTICLRLKWWMTTPSFLGSYCVHPPSYRTTFFESGPYFPPAPFSKYVLKCEIARDGADFEGCRTPGHSNPVFVLAPAPPQLCLKPILPSRRISPTDKKAECCMWLGYGLVWLGYG